jgi:hypothetical protein
MGSCSIRKGIKEGTKLERSPPFRVRLFVYCSQILADRSRIVAKKQELSYHVAEVLRTHIPQLQHGHDGLIFTCAESEYVLGTDEKMYATLFLSVKVEC